MTDRDRENVAAAWFTAVLAAVAGGAGILIAALAVGIQRVWSGRERPPAGRGEGWRQSVADHRVWLERDAAARAEWREARRQWWRDGADPETRPQMPGVAARVGSWLRRAWARTVVGAQRLRDDAARFAQGWRDGWAAARDARADGANWWETARTRPGDDADPWADEPDGWWGLDSETSTPRAEQDARPKDPAPRERDARRSWGPDPEPPQATDQPVVPNDNEGDAMSDTTTAPAAPTAGETHLDLNAADLARINAQLTRIAELNDQLAAARDELSEEVKTANERVNASGGTAATRQALDEAGVVVDLLGQHVGGVADAAVAAGDAAGAAEEGLAPARDAQDTLHAAGATGKYVSAATSD